MRLLLIRHAHHDYIGRAIAGWLPGVSLSELGRRQAQELPARLAGAGIGAIYSSPLERARETAAPLAASLGLPVELRDGLREIDFGEFTGRTMKELDCDPAWHHFNLHRGSARAPGGEMMLETQARMVAELERIRAAHAGPVVAVFSHSDVIRAALLHYLGMPLDLYGRIEIEPASASVLELAGGSARVLRLNEIR
ncbi:MAG TPA: histidine phosphatase family protein [Bryobacteraceae bacterium]|nr:histidine phosphatase family protein [Bryobacteraceae bacterium]